MRFDLSVAGFQEDQCLIPANCSLDVMNLKLCTWLM